MKEEEEKGTKGSNDVDLVLGCSFSLNFLSLSSPLSALLPLKASSQLCVPKILADSSDKMMWQVNWKLVSPIKFRSDENESPERYY